LILQNYGWFLPISVTDVTMKTWFLSKTKIIKIYTWNFYTW